VINWKIN